MKIIEKPSTHFNERLLPIDMIVLHATATDTLAQTFYYLIEKEDNNRVSAHYVIDRDGTIYRLVPDDKRAWHAGVSLWDGQTDNNSRSIGIEFQCPVVGDESFAAFTEEQIQAGLALCRELMQKYHILPHNVVAHSDIAPTRKVDPGRTFPWERFFAEGLAENPLRRPLDVVKR